MCMRDISFRSYCVCASSSFSWCVGCMHLSKAECDWHMQIHSHINPHCGASSMTLRSYQDLAYKIVRNCCYFKKPCPRIDRIDKKVEREKNLDISKNSWKELDWNFGTWLAGLCIPTHARMCRYAFYFLENANASFSMKLLCMGLHHVTHRHMRACLTSVICFHQSKCR